MQHMCRVKNQTFPRKFNSDCLYSCLIQTIFYPNQLKNNEELGFLDQALANGSRGYQRAMRNYGRWSDKGAIKLPEIILS